MNELASELSKLPKAYLVEAWILAVDPSIKATGLALFDSNGKLTWMDQVPITMIHSVLHDMKELPSNVIMIREYQRPFRAKRAGRIIRGGNSMIEAGNAIEREIKRLWPRMNKCFKVSPRTWQAACGCNIANDTKAYSINRLRADGFECKDSQDGMADAYNIGQWFMNQLRLARQIAIAA